MKLTFSIRIGYSENYGGVIGIWQIYYSGIIRSDLSKPPVKLIGWNHHSRKTIKNFHKRIKF